MSNLACTPTIGMSQLQDPIFQASVGATGTAQWPARSLLQRRQTAFLLVSLAPLVAGFTGNPKLTAQLGQCSFGKLLSLRNESNLLLHRVGVHPRHDQTLTPLIPIKRGGAVLRALARCAAD